MDIVSIIRLKSGMLEEVKSFHSGVNSEAEGYFAEKIKEAERDISDEDIEACLDNGHFEDSNGNEIFIVQNELSGEPEKQS